MQTHGISFSEALRVWVRIATLSFGGPAGQIAVMHRIIVDEKRWLSEARFLHALNYCMLLPGPEAQQLATYIGWLMHGVRGGLAAGLLFILPGIIAIMALSYVYALFGSVGFVAAFFFGLKAAVLAIVVEAVVRVGKRALKNAVMQALAASAFIALFVFNAPFPLVILTAGIIGYLGSSMGSAAFLVSSGHGASEATALEDSSISPAMRQGARRAAGRPAAHLPHLLHGAPGVAPYAVLPCRMLTCACYYNLIRARSTGSISTPRFPRRARWAPPTPWAPSARRGCCGWTRPRSAWG